jgi:hypothetical protein
MIPKYNKWYGVVRDARSGEITEKVPLKDHLQGFEWLNGRLLFADLRYEEITVEAEEVQANA